MVQRDEIPEDVNDIEQYLLLVNALEDAQAPYEYTPFGATKTAELDIQFGIDPSFGLTKERYGWYSNGTLFDSTFFTERDGKILVETSATAGDIARIRSAFPGQYLAHTIAEPGIGASVPSKHLEYDSNDYVSLTHGEISLEVASWSDSNDRSLNAHGISLESDGAYHQVRSGDTDVAFVPQNEWNIDKMDGDGPSGTVLQPERGYIWLFIYSWYGEGAYILAVQDPRSEDIYPVNRYEPTEGNPSIETPNMPVQFTVENKNTADPLSAEVGGMQFSVHGKSERGVSRTTEVTRRTGNNYIDLNVTTNNNEIDSFAEPGRPLVSARRDENDIISRKSLSMEVISEYINSGGDIYIFIWDEFDPETALTGENWRTPHSRDAQETRIQVDTEATDYTPTTASLRGMQYIAGDKNSAETIAGDSTAQLPLEATMVITAALPVGDNSTYAQPILTEIVEGF